MTAIIMTVAILVVYKVARALDWALSLPALVACGVCALLINFLSIPVAPFLTEYRFTVLGAMILVAAVVVTSVNHFFIRKKRKQLEAAKEESIQLEQEAVEIKEELVPVVNAAILSSEEVEALTAKDSEPIPEPIPEPEPTPTPVIVDEPKVEEEIPEPEPVIEPEPKVEEEIPEPEPVIEPEPEVEEEIPEPVVEAEPEVEEEAPKEPETETEEEAPEAETEEISEPEAEEEIPEPEAEEEIPEPEPEPEPVPEPTVEDKLTDTNTLDDVLDYAFELKGNSDWASALKAYQYALEQYREDAYAPFLVLEIINIHKDHGRYDEAIQCFYDALEIPAVADSPDMLAEFEDSMIYLEATKEVLAAENQPDTPFFDIPKDYMSKIESIYNERKARSI